MSATKDILFVRELLEKDLGYLKNKVDKIDKHLENLNGQVAENTLFRQKFKWTASFIVTAASVISFSLMVISYKMQWFGK